MFSSSPPPIDRRQSLAGIPVLNPGVEVTPRDDDRVTVTVVRQRGSGFLARFQPPIIRRSFKLDELGTYVVRLIDGERTVLQIIERFVRDHRVNRREAELSVVQFIRMLTQRNVISIVIP